MSTKNPSVEIAGWTFDHGDYDAVADVLYLSIGEPRAAIGEETPEGHVWMLDVDTSQVCGLTIVSVNYLMHEHGEIKISLPLQPPVSVGDADVGGLLVGA